MWENLPNHLKTGLSIALILVVGVAVAGFALSFVALRDVAANPVTGWGDYAWIFPLCVDAALLAAEVTYISVSMIRGVNRALPFCLIVLFAALTVWFNIERVPAAWRIVTAAPPVAGIFMTLCIAYLLKAMARVTGRTMAWDAPSSAEAGALTAQGPIPGSIYRQTQVTHGQTDITDGQGTGRGEHTKAAILAAAADLGPQEVRTIGPSGLATYLADSHGIRTTGKYVRQVLSEDGWTTGRNGHGKS